jgi:hypothetical protein
VGVGVGGWARLQKAIARIDPTLGDQTLKTENLLRKRVWLNEINFGDFDNLWLFLAIDGVGPRFSAVKP